VPADDQEFYQLVTSEALFDRRGQVLGFAFGALAVLLFRPWLMLWQLLASMLLPVAAYIVPALLLQVLQRWLSS
jgi:hypothetical protein